jgi:hypothetical protein
MWCGVRSNPSLNAHKTLHLNRSFIDQYNIRANQLSDEEAATDLGLPLAQIKEAQLYYRLKRELIEREVEVEKEDLLAKVIALAPRHIPG